MSELLLYPDENGVLHEAPEFRTVVCFETKEEQERFDKRINNMNKYRWHDLRKNPNDLPKDNERDLLVFTNGAFVVWTGKLLNICKAGVDRWKRIEPFEEAE